MPNEEADFPKREKNAAKSCCLAAMIVGLGFFLLIFTAIAGIIIVDTINLRGEKFTLSKRVERYKVAAQFIWFDFKDWVSRRFSESSPSEPEIIQCPAEPPETQPESEPQETQPESEPQESELDSELESEFDSAAGPES